jgi:hypothetical protein
MTRLAPKEKARRAAARIEARRAKRMGKIFAESIAEFSSGVSGMHMMLHHREYCKIVPPHILKLKPPVDHIYKALQAQTDIECKAQDKAERAKWRESHPQWFLRDLDRALEHPYGGDDAAFTANQAAWKARNNWFHRGTPMTEAVLGKPTRKASESELARAAELAAAGEQAEADHWARFYQHPSAE